jgi:flagella basal body P-ring formation protein FlgA
MIFSLQSGILLSRGKPLQAATACLGLFSVLMGFGLEVSAQTLTADTLPSWEPPEAIVAQVRVLVAEEWNVDPENLVLEWTRPRNPVSFDWLHDINVLGGGRNGHWIVSLRLENTDPDRISLPMKAGIRRWVPVAATTLSRGQTLGSEDLEYHELIHWGPSIGYPEMAEPGWVAQRRIDAGDVLTRPGVRPPLMVVSGRPVQLIWSSGPLKISLAGTAVGSGSEGETVFVRTEEGKRMSGVITGPGTVLLSNPGTRGES